MNKITDTPHYSYSFPYRKPYDGIIMTSHLQRDGKLNYQHLNPYNVLLPERHIPFPKMAKHGGPMPWDVLAKQSKPTGIYTGAK